MSDILNRIAKNIFKNIMTFDPTERIKFIKTFALENKITYEQAKKICKKKYPQLFPGMYWKVNLKVEVWKVPQELIISMIFEDGLSFNQIDSTSINKKIYEDYVKEDNKDLQNIKDYRGYIRKLREIYEEAKGDKTIPEAIYELQTRIKEFAESNNVNTMIATICVCYDFSIEEAKKVEYVLSYNEKNNIESSCDILEDYRKYLLSATELKRTTLHGITIVSPTEEGLNYLIYIIKKAFLYGEEDYKKQLEQLSKEHHLILTNYGLFDDSACHKKGVIYMSDYLIKDLYAASDWQDSSEIIDTFFHESTHFIDWCLGYYSETEQRVRAVLEKIRIRINKRYFELKSDNPNANYDMESNEGIINMGQLYKDKTCVELAVEYSQDEAMRKKWEKVIIEEYVPKSRHEFDMYLDEKKIYERNICYRLMRRIFDIYDAIAKGQLYDDYGLPGHGREYYETEGLDVNEFIAHIGIFFNNDCMDVLIYEFGEEITKELMDIYKEMLERSKEQYDGMHNTNNDETMKVA